MVNLSYLFSWGIEASWSDCLLDQATNLNIYIYKIIICLYIIWVSVIEEDGMITYHGM